MTPEQEQAIRECALDNSRHWWLSGDRDRIILLDALDAVRAELAESHATARRELRYLQAEHESLVATLTRERDAALAVLHTILWRSGAAKQL